MIAQGGDGLSRGVLNEGVMRGEDFLSFIPFHLSAFEREPKLMDWIRKLVNTISLLHSYVPKPWMIGSKGDMLSLNSPLDRTITRFRSYNRGRVYGPLHLLLAM